MRTDICIYDNCKKQRNYNHLNETKPLYCNDHKFDGMINVVSKRCKYDGCTKIPSFNTYGHYTAFYCKLHKSNDMVNVVTRKCYFTGCNKTPVFNDPGNASGKFCNEHKEDGMINVKNPKCNNDQCTKIPNFNYPDKTYGVFCLSHKLNGMVDIKNKHKICQHKECNIRANFNYTNQSRAILCSNHKEKGMININEIVCTHLNCTSKASYGLPGEQRSRCAKHISNGMIRKPKTKCTFIDDNTEKCCSIALYGLHKPLFCEKHKESFHINMVERNCKSCNIIQILNKNDLCCLCDPDKMNIIKLAKQNQIKCMLDTFKYDYVSHDKMIDMGYCFKYRPDFLFDCKTHFVVLEVDEHQHNNYTSTCEETRMINIFQSLGITTFFIRYNPDEYRFNNKKQNPSYSMRVKCLQNTLNCVLNTTLPYDDNNYVYVKYLYYDNIDNINDFKKIDVSKYGM